MTKETFISLLEDRLSFLPNRKKAVIITKYRKLIDNAINLGLDEQSFIDGLGNVNDLVSQIENEHLTKKQSMQLNISNTLQKVIIYSIAALISLGVFIILFASFSFGLSWFIFGINRLISVTSATVPASYALYIGQMVFGIGFWILLIGIVIKIKPNYRNIIFRLQTLFNKSAKEDL
jgi:uncharacterized membrane protein